MPEIPKEFLKMEVFHNKKGRLLSYMSHFTVLIYNVNIEGSIILITKYDTLLTYVTPSFIS